LEGIKGAGKVVKKVATSNAGGGRFIVLKKRGLNTSKRGGSVKVTTGLAA